MKLRTVLIAVCTLGSTLPAMANGPGMSEDPGASSNTGNMSSQRERWTRHRVERLRREREKQERQMKAIDKDRGNAAALRMLAGEDPLVVTKGDNTRAEIARRREINTIEYLSLKKERGELSPAGERYLRALIRSVREGH
jgi:hypothetical protein